MNPHSIIKNITDTTQADYVLPSPSPGLPSRHHCQIVFHPVFCFVSQISYVHG